MEERLVSLFLILRGHVILRTSRLDGKGDWQKREHTLPPGGRSCNLCSWNSPLPGYAMANKF